MENNSPKRWKKRKIFGIAVLLVLLLSFLTPEARLIPVHQATSKDWHQKTFWFEPWGKSGVHKGVDIFAPMDTPVISASHGLVLYRGQFARGGNVIVILGPKMRVHYYAHLASVDEGAGFIVHAGETIGGVGDTGNAKGKPPHLHYSLVSLLPMIWHADDSTQGWKKMFFIDPTTYFDHSQARSVTFAH